jgi:hypothetical protein
MPTLLLKQTEENRPKKKGEKKRLGDVSRIAIELQQDPQTPLFQLQNY